MMPSVLFEIKDDIALITLNRPERMNAFNRKMAFLLQQLLYNCAADESIRAVYLTGKGTAFSAGQDLGELTGENPPPMEAILSEHFNPIIRQIRNLEKPVLCAVNGVAAGAGANIALACDLVVADASAWFIQAFSKIGLIPDSGGTFILPRLIGFQKATALMMLGEKLSAREAERIGMIYAVFETVHFAESSWKIAATLAKMPTRALALTKQALNASLSQSLEQQLNTEDQLQQAASQTNDYKEGVAAFLEKRKAHFKGK